MSIAVNTKILSVVNFFASHCAVGRMLSAGKIYYEEKIMNKGEEVDASEGSCSGRYAE